MQNVFHHGKGRKISWKYLFDLKGCQDDKLLQENGESIPEVHLRWFKFYMCWYGFQCCCSRDCALFCCQTPERQRYFNGKKFAYDGKLHMSSRDKATYSELLKNDIVFLKNHEVMDYSLLIGIQEFNSIEMIINQNILGKFT
mmetsp:Transcript_26134/g.36192  ORF Transcript_26134/g.36192 Transcript_26134/m.36192 type:complete len:142 (+) Transcript_26134:482-907(+)